jgi:hypothetical protein
MTNTEFWNITLSIPLKVNGLSEDPEDGSDIFG